MLGAGFGISRATAYRYHDEAVGVLAARAPNLAEALQRVQADGWAFVILDGKFVDTDRCAATKISKKGKVIDAWYAGKTHDFGGNVQAVMRPDGLPIWVSEVEPGSTHDLTVAREHALGALYPVKQSADGRALDMDTRTYTMLLRSLRCLGERGLALLTQRWRALQHITASPSRIGDLTKAALVLTHFEHRCLFR